MYCYSACFCLCLIIKIRQVIRVPGNRFFPVALSIPLYSLSFQIHCGSLGRYTYCALSPFLEGGLVFLPVTCLLATLGKRAVDCLIPFIVCYRHCGPWYVLPLLQLLFAFGSRSGYFPRSRLLDVYDLCMLPTFSVPLWSTACSMALILENIFFVFQAFYDCISFIWLLVCSAF